MKVTKCVSSWCRSSTPDSFPLASPSTCACSVAQCPVIFAQFRHYYWQAVHLPQYQQNTITARILQRHIFNSHVWERHKYEHRLPYTPSWTVHFHNIVSARPAPCNDLDTFCYSKHDVLKESNCRTERPPINLHSLFPSDQQLVSASFHPFCDVHDTMSCIILLVAWDYTLLIICMKWGVPHFSRQSQITSHASQGMVVLWSGHCSILLFCEQQFRH